MGHVSLVRSARMLAALGGALLLFVSLPAGAFGVICCNVIIDTPSANWVGYSRECAKDMPKVSQADQEKVCLALRTSAPTCDLTSKICKPCTSKLYEDYKRKEQHALELFKHASELRLKAVYLIGERIAGESKTLRIEVEKDLAAELAWQDFGRHVVRGMRDSRAALNEAKLVRVARENAPFGAKAWNALGWIGWLAEVSARGYLTYGEWSHIQRTAQDAMQRAADLHTKAIKDLEAHLKQQPGCLYESRKAAEDQKKLDRAREIIEEWDQSQALYRDPITKEALDYDAAVKRAKQLLDSGQISSYGQFIRVTTASERKPPSQESLAAAINELDTAIASFERLHKHVTAYLKAERAMEAKLQRALGTAPIEGKKSPRKQEKPPVK